jgi:5'(3')-deoxyribonucleotidase
MPSEFVLGVDLDGVCGDHRAAFAEVVARERGIDPLTLPPQESWDFAEWGLTPDGFERLHRKAVLTHRMFRSMPAMDQCAEVLWRLSDAGVWIRLITHRLYANWGHATAVADTVSWLDEQGIPYRDLCFLGQKPQVEADAYVDDAPHNVEALRATGAYVIVFDQPYNARLEGPRAGSWAAVERLVLDLLAASGRPVQGQLPVSEPPPRRLQGRLPADQAGTSENRESKSLARPQEPPTGRR